MVVSPYLLLMHLYTGITKDKHPRPLKSTTRLSSNIPEMMVSDTFSLTSKVAVVTGTGRENGIGAAIARALACNGSALAIHHVSEASAPRAQAVAQGIVREGGRACVVQADITSPAGAKKLVAETMRAFGVDKVDILGNIWLLDPGARRSSVC